MTRDILRNISFATEREANEFIEELKRTAMRNNGYISVYDALEIAKYPKAKSYIDKHIVWHISNLNMAIAIPCDYGWRIIIP